MPETLIFALVLLGSAYLAFVLVYLFVRDSEIVRQLLAFERMMVLVWGLPLTSPNERSRDARASPGRPFFQSSRWYP